MKIDVTIFSKTHITILPYVLKKDMSFYLLTILSWKVFTKKIKLFV